MWRNTSGASRHRAVAHNARSLPPSGSGEACRKVPCGPSAPGRPVCYRPLLRTSPLRVAAAWRPLRSQRARTGTAASFKTVSFSRRIFPWGKFIKLNEIAIFQKCTPCIPGHRVVRAAEWPCGRKTARHRQGNPSDRLDRTHGTPPGCYRVRPRESAWRRARVGRPVSVTPESLRPGRSSLDAPRDPARERG